MWVVAGAIVRRLVDALRAPVGVGVHDLLVAATIGIADAAPGEDAVEVMRRADVAMSAAKEGGSRQHRRYTPELDDRAGEAARLGLTAVAEGVETAEQAAELYRLRYELAQGYHFGRPVAEPDFRDQRGPSSSRTLASSSS